MLLEYDATSLLSRCPTFTRKTVSSTLQEPSGTASCPGRVKFSITLSLQPFESLQGLVAGCCEHSN